MNKTDILALFPLKGELTQEILDTSDVTNFRNCPGARTLRAALPQLADNELATWGWATGSISRLDITGKTGWHVDLTTEEGIDFTQVTKPQLVTFKINTYA